MWKVRDGSDLLDFKMLEGDVRKWCEKRYKNKSKICLWFPEGK